MSATVARMKPLQGQAVISAWAALMAVVCTVLFLLAIEQTQAVAAWHGVRGVVASLVSAPQRVVVSAPAIPSPQKSLSDWLPTFSSAPAADAGDRVLTGEFRAEGAGAEQIGAVTFDGSRLRLASGLTLRTEPLHIYAGRDAALQGETFARRLSARPNAQIEARRFVPVTGAANVSVLAACGGERPSSLALLYRQDRVDLMIYRRGAAPGHDVSASALCGRWMLRRSG